MKKKALVLLLALSCTLSMAACSGSESAGTFKAEDAFEEESTEVTEETTEEETETESEEETETEEETKKSSSNMPADLSDDIYDFQISIDGDIYQFPMWYSEFEALGWTYDGDSSETLSSNQYTTTEVWEKDGVKVYTGFANLSMNTAPYSECEVTGITLDKFYLEDCDWEIILPGGIQYGVSDADEIKEAYGTPTSDYDGDLYYSMTYEYDLYQEIQLYVYKESNTLEEIKIRNMVELEGADNSVDETVPDVVKNYVAPTSVGDDFYSFNVEFEGNLYTLPCPVTEFLANGFEINESDSDAVIAANNNGWIELKYNNMTLRALAYNYADYATVLENCFVTSVETSEYDPQFDLVIPGGIKRGDSESKLKKAINVFNYESETSDSGYTYYEIYNPEGSILDSYDIVVKDGVITSIEVSNSESPEE